MAFKCLHISLVIALFSAILPGHAKAVQVNNDSLLQQYEDSLNILQYEKIKHRASDEYKLNANAKFTALLKKALMLPGSFTYPFDSLKTIAHITSPDKKFRIYNWDVPMYDESINYYCFIQCYDAVKKTYTLYELHDQSAKITKPDYQVCTPDNWLGMLYYKIIPDGQEKDTYLLLGWQGYSNLITHKIIDVLSFNGKGEPEFGKAIFHRPPPGFKSSYKRLIFQYSAKVFMSLDYDSKSKMILFDHLGPPDPSLTGQYQFYGPGFQVDALALKNNRWEYIANVDARNPKSTIDKNYHPEGEDFRKPKKAIYTPQK